MKRTILNAIAGAAIFFTATALYPCSYFTANPAGTLCVQQKDAMEYEVKPGGTLNISLTGGGDIEIKGWDKNLFSSDSKSDGSADIKYSKEGNDIKVTSLGGSDIKITVFVPKKFNVVFTTSNGDVNIEQIEGSIKGATMAGDLYLNGINGKLSLTTMGGDITLKNSKAEGKVNTKGGNVLVENVEGNVDASSNGGSVKQINVTQTAKGKGKTSSAGKETNISSLGGDLIIDEAANGAKLATLGGDISVNHAGKFLSASTNGGDITAKSVDGWITAKTLGGDIDVTMTGNPNDGKRDVTLNSLGGDITLKVPKGLSMNIDIEIAYTKDNKVKKFEDYKVESNIQLQQERTGEWDNSQGTPRKFIYAKANVNGGKNTIKIRTINGNVYLKQQ